jgi:hypothetical protein
MRPIRPSSQVDVGLKNSCPESRAIKFLIEASSLKERLRLLRDQMNGFSSGTPFGGGVLLDLARDSMKSQLAEFFEPQEVA